MNLACRALALLSIMCGVDGGPPRTTDVGVCLYLRDTTFAVREPSSVVVEVYNGSDKELIIRCPPVWYEKMRILPAGVSGPATTKTSVTTAGRPAGDIATGGTALDCAYLVLRVWVPDQTNLMGMGHSGAYDPEVVTIPPKEFHLFKVQLPDNTFLHQGQFYIEAAVAVPAQELVWSPRVRVWAK